MESRRTAKETATASPRGAGSIKVLTEQPKKSDMSKWDDPTLGFDITNKIGYFKYKNKFLTFELTEI